MMKSSVRRGWHDAPHLTMDVNVPAEQVMMSPITLASLSSLKSRDLISGIEQSKLSSEAYTFENVPENQSISKEKTLGDQFSSMKVSSDNIRQVFGDMDRRMRESAIINYQFTLEYYKSLSGSENVSDRIRSTEAILDKYANQNPPFPSAQNPTDKINILL